MTIIGFPARGLARLGLAAFCFVLRSMGQRPPADPLIRVSVNLVQVDAVVTDAKGKHVAGLTANDFQVFEDGKPQKVTHLSYIDAAPPSYIAPPAGQKKTDPVPVKGPSRLLKRDEVRRAVMFLVDDVHTTGEDLGRLGPVAKKFVAEQVQPGDLVSMYCCCRD